MLTAIYLIFTLYNIPNFRNSLSLFTTIILMASIVMFIAYALFINMVFGSFVRYTICNLKRGVPFEIIKLIPLSVIILTQFVYPGYEDITTKYNNLITPEEITDDWYDSIEQYEVYNTFMLPKGIKQSFVIMNDVSTALKDYSSDVDALKEWYYDNIDDITYQKDQIRREIDIMYYMVIALVLIKLVQKITVFILNPDNRICLLRIYCTVRSVFSREKVGV